MIIITEDNNIVNFDNVHTIWAAGEQHAVAYEEDYHRDITLENVRFNDIEHNDVQLFGVDGFTMYNIQSNVTGVANSRIVTRQPVVHIGTKKKGHLLDGGKVDLFEPKGNKNISIVNADKNTIIME